MSQLDGMSKFGHLIPSRCEEAVNLPIRTGFGNWGTNSKLDEQTPEVPKGRP